ncbi:MAG: hypothetical protein ACK55I_10510, partial [bacterium]
AARGGGDGHRTGMAGEARLRRFLRRPIYPLPACLTASTLIRRGTALEAGGVCLEMNHATPRHD